MPEVDLTEDKSYSNLTTMPRSATNVLPEIFRESSIPWNFSTSYTLPRIVHSDAELGQVPLVFTGDAETINFMREVAEAEEGKRCDCCGKLITTPLWDMPAGSLCPECAQRLEETVHGKQETPWQKIEQPKPERLIPWWYDL